MHFLFFYTIGGASNPVAYQGFNF